MTSKHVLILAALALGLVSATSTLAADPKTDPKAEVKSGAAASAPAQPSLSVTLTSPVSSALPQRLSANGSVMAWQEVIVGAETQGLRIVEVHAQVGDRVKRGQLLARLSSDTLAADVAATRANLAEAEAAMQEAQANAERARQLQSSGAISAQQIQQYTTLEATARARAAALRARLRADEVRLGQTRIAASDDGVISARTATVGAVVQPGQELFRLIRQRPSRVARRSGRHASWSRLAAGARHGSRRPVRAAVEGACAWWRRRWMRPRATASSTSTCSRRRPPRAGMLRAASSSSASSPRLTLPQSAVLLRDGFSYVFRSEPTRRSR